MVINVKMKKSLTGVLLSLILAGSFVTPAVSVLAADEVAETVPAVEVTPAVETAPVAEAAAKTYGLYVELFQDGELVLNNSKGNSTTPLTEEGFREAALLSEDEEFKLVKVEFYIDHSASNSDITWYVGKIYLESRKVTPPSTEQLCAVLLYDIIWIDNIAS